MAKDLAKFDPNAHYGPLTELEPEAFDSLKHYGVPGMKWGRRKGSRGSNSKASKAMSTVPHRQRVVVNSLGQVVTPEKGAKLRKASAKVEKQLAKSKTAYLSDAELQKRINRLNMEKSYAKLTHQKSKLEKGQEAAKVIVGLTASAATVYKFAKSPAGQVIADILYRKMSPADALVPRAPGRHRA